MAETLSQAQSFDNRAIDPARDVQPVILLITSQSISSRRANAAIDCSMVVSLSGQGRLDLAHARIRTAVVVFGWRVFIRGVAIIVIAIVIIGIRGVGIVAVSPRIPGTDDHPGVIVPTAPVTAPIMIAIPAPISRLLRQDASLTTVETLRPHRGRAISCASRIKTRVDSGIERSRAIRRKLPGSGGHSISRHRPRRETLG
jgi:hypothetical protein